jgi:hypothetical protein
MTVTAAYNQLPKRPKAKRAASDESRDSNPTVLPGPVEALSSGNANQVSETAASATRALEESGVSHEQHIQEACDGEPQSSAVALVSAPRAEPEVLDHRDPRRNERSHHRHDPRADAGTAFVGDPVAKTQRVLSQQRRAFPDSNVAENPFDIDLADDISDECTRGKRTDNADTGQEAAVPADDQRGAFDLALDVIDESIGAMAEGRMNDAVDARDRVVRRLDATIARVVALQAGTRQVEQQSLEIAREGDQGADNEESTPEHAGKDTISTKTTRRIAAQNSTKRRLQSGKPFTTAPSEAEVDALINPWGSQK